MRKEEKPADPRFEVRDLTDEMFFLKNGESADRMRFRGYSGRGNLTEGFKLTKHSADCFTLMVWAEDGNYAGGSDKIEKASSEDCFKLFKKWFKC